MVFKSTFFILAVVLFLGCDSTKSQNTTPTQITSPHTELKKSLQTYYKAALNKKGTDLKDALHTIIRKSTSFSYSQAYNLLDIIDQDPNNSNNVILFYTQTSRAANEKCHSSSQDCWNREHMWPKSLGVGYDDSVAAYTDLQHLRPTDAVVNSDRGNKIYGVASVPYPKIAHFYWDTSASIWEVSDNLKGDVARVILYMTVRYEGDDNEPDLEIYAGDESISRPAELCLMLEWNELDKVSENERKRNDLIYSYQKNRNPFIDNQQWVEDIWETMCK